MSIVHFKSDGLNLEGKLEHPHGAKVLAIIINGSGKINKDGNLANMKLTISADIAHFLASQNIASFRFDKRGVGNSEGNYLQATFDDNIKDVHAAIDYMH